MNMIDNAMSTLLRNQIQNALLPLIDLITQLRDDNRLIKDELLVIKSQQSVQTDLITALLKKLEALETDTIELLASDNQEQKMNDNPPKQPSSQQHIPIQLITQNAPEEQQIKQLEQQLNQTLDDINQGSFQNQSQQKCFSQSNNSSQQSDSDRNNQTQQYPIFFGTRTGKKFHKFGCEWLKTTDYPLTQTQALTQGLTQCSQCLYL